MEKLIAVLQLKGNLSAVKLIMREYCSRGFPKKGMKSDENNFTRAQLRYLKNSLLTLLYSLARIKAGIVTTVD